MFRFNVIKIDRIMKKLCFLWILIIVGCANENSLEKEIAAIPMDVNISRFDQVFLNATPSDLPKLKEVYPLFFPSSIADSTWVYTMQDPLQKELKHEIDLVFTDFASVQNDIKKIILYQDVILVALNTYLGENHKYYEGIQNYIVQNFTKEMIPVDIADEFAYAQVIPSRNRSFLSKMIYHGKAQYIKSILVPKVSTALQFGYTEQQVKWSEANEAQIWTHFIEKELLYSTNNKLDARFLNLAPFSKFYLELDSESPGGIGRYIGFRIVDAYMKNNDVSLQELIGKSTEEIYNNSKYKPRK